MVQITFTIYLYSTNTHKVLIGFFSRATETSDEEDDEKDKQQL